MEEAHLLDNFLSLLSPFSLLTVFIDITATISERPSLVGPTSASCGWGGRGFVWVQQGGKLHYFRYVSSSHFIRLALMSRLSLLRKGDFAILPRIAQ